MTEKVPARRLIWAAMAIVYVLWGSTYLGIKLVTESLPPLLSGSARFVVAGAILGLVALATGQLRSDPPSRRQWRNAAISGALLMGGGNAGVVLAEQRIDTGVTALIVSLAPLLIAVYLLLLFHDPLPWRAWLGLVLGLGGLALLIQTGGGLSDPLGLAAGVASVTLWSAGSVVASRTAMPARPMLGSAAQMVCGGLVMAVEGILFGEPWRFHPDQVRWQSVAALAYLIVFGSLIAFSAFAWLLRVVHVSLVATSAYVNPVVAVLLGVAVLGERISFREALAGAVILAAVILIVTARSGTAPAPATEVPPDPG